MDEILQSVAGNPACWHDIFDFDYCCDRRHGPRGNAECWDGYYNFNHCCYTPLHAATAPECWEEAKYYLSKSEEAAAKHPALKVEANLATFCCHASSLSSAACWGSTRPTGSPELRDASTGERLGFTRRHIECCFPELKQLAKNDVPEWMATQIDHDLRAWEDQVFEKAGRGADLCRFQIRKDAIFHCDFGRSRYYSLLHSLRAALHILHAMFGLPEVDLLIHTSEFYGVDAPEINLTVPVLVQAQPEGCNGILMPWWAFLQWEWTRRYRDRLEQASADVQWQDRDSLLFWRGSDTGCLLPGAEISCARSCSEWNSTTWPLFPRSKLVLASSVFPGRIDAVFTKDTVHRECQDVYDSSGLRVGEIVPPEAHVLHKYLAYVDGTSFSDRLFWLLQTDSLVFRAASSIRVWLDTGLKAWTHYVPVRENLSDLLDRLDWAKQNDDASARISADAAQFAKTHLTLDASLFYLYQLLVRLGKVIQLTPIEISVPQPEFAPEPVVEVDSGLDCWAFGFSPAFCCKVEEYGPGGNPACWDGPYTFDLCCGEMSSHPAPSGKVVVLLSKQGKLARIL
ncbi:Protein O-glucosyltransferase 2 (Endoplasmic reticulum resident protein 58) (ER protein 58) (ERp58) (KDEL motif-containing protein 1) (Protein O-xylosyltransferase POGLUT2) [Durusdinium trenchii]|uniref:Protein O-glucosyltransferase 2 (Endoplasmic reticulum resident protein 58) (ER protein 58) (ERp58) (KDEL motif-containing protein 1) (Protein O-xylosyltransferase POGLUT2) n=1 Tax=Durusdinium trenchii TaxID=1381693 RepID=A0ABP0ID98_9DINO